MGKKNVTIAPGANPFDKTRTAAEQMFAPQPPSEAEPNDVDIEQHNAVDKVDVVGHVEQHIQQHQQIQQDEPKKKEPRKFPGKQHIHLILPDEQANMVKQLAKMSGISVNQFMSKAIDILYEERWKPVVELLEQNRHKLGMDKKTNKDIFS